MFSQQRTGISYQALILNPNGEQLPGYNNQNAPLVNTDICLEFLIIDENGSTEYSETQSVKTDKYGMVNLSIGNGNFAGGYSGGWSGIVWSEKSKKLKVNLDTTGSCSSFTEISNQDLTAVPFALFAPGQEGLDGDSAYEIWLSEGNLGTVTDYLGSLKGEKGEDGLSAFQIWKDLGNTETEEDFITALKGEDGKSAYQIWLDAGNTGTEEEFLNSLKGESGGDGESASQSLINTTIEVAGQNCANGGIKIETGIDTNKDGILGADEVNSSQTKYLCNGEDGEDGEDGQDSTDSGGSGDGCSQLELITVYEYAQFENQDLGTRIESDRVSSMYPGAINNDADQYLTQGTPKTNDNSIKIMEFDNLNTYRFLINSYDSENTIPLHLVSVKAFDSNNNQLKVTFKIENITTSPSTGGGANIKNLSSNISPMLMYYNANQYYDYMGSDERNGKYRGVIEILSTTKINKVSITYYPPQLPSSAVYGEITISIFRGVCGELSSVQPLDNNPPSDLKVGDIWGGGYVFYIAPVGSTMYVNGAEKTISQGEIHGLITPINYYAFGGQDYCYRANCLVTGAKGGIGYGELNTELMVASYLPLQYEDSYYNINNSGAALACYTYEHDGYTDWYLPNHSEYGLMVNELPSTMASGGHYHNSGPNVTVFPWKTGNTITSTAKWRPIRNF